MPQMEPGGIWPVVTFELDCTVVLDDLPENEILCNIILINVVLGFS